VGLVEFMLSPPDIVRSINQLSLLKTWTRLRGLSQLASIEAVSPEGGFDCRHLLAPRSLPPAFALCAIIDTGEAIIGSPATAGR
jgi:hypothetical protein